MFPTALHQSIALHQSTAVHQSSGICGATWLWRKHRKQQNKSAPLAKSQHNKTNKSLKTEQVLVPRGVCIPKYSWACSGRAHSSQPSLCPGVIDRQVSALHYPNFILNDVQPLQPGIQLMLSSLLQFASLCCKADTLTIAPLQIIICLFCPWCTQPSLFYTNSPVLTCCFILTLLSKVQPTSWPSFLSISLIFITLFICLQYQASFPLLSVCSIPLCALIMPLES